jgi:hypothetical protein
MKKGGWVTGAGCGVELGAAHPWQGEAVVALDGGARPTATVAPCFGVRGGRKSWWAGWVERLNMPVGWLCWLGRILKIISFQNKNWIFEYTKALENCTRKFRRNFDVGIFPKFF